MLPRSVSPLRDRVRLVHFKEAGLSLAAASQRLGYSHGWGRKWWRRYRDGGEAALAPPPPSPSQPLTTFAAAVQEAVYTYRQTYPLAGARRARMELTADPALAGMRLPSARTIHRAWRAAGLVTARMPRDGPLPTPLPVLPADDLHAVWEIDHQDGLQLGTVPEPVVLQGVRAPAAGLIVGATLFPGPHGAHAVPVDDVLDGLRQSFATWGRPTVLSVDQGVHFIGQPQRQFPSQLELFCAGLGITLRPIRPRHPTDHGAIERQHRTLDAVLLGPPYADLGEAQAALDRQVRALNEQFPSRARGCGGQPPLVAHPRARHSGRPYDPRQEAERFDLSAVDAVLSQWTWHRQIGQRTGQITFGTRHVSVGKRFAGLPVTLRFDPTDRNVAVFAPGTSRGEPGPVLKRFACAAFAPATIRGHSRLAAPPSEPSARSADTTEGTTL